MHEFCNLHLHSHYSFRDGLATVEELVDKTVELGHRAMALTEHGTLGSVIPFYSYATERGIKPIIGIEAYIVDNPNRRKPGKALSRHIVLLAKNNDGYKNLIRLSTDSYLNGFYYNPRINFEILEEYSNGLVCMTACLGGILAKALCQNKESYAYEKARQLKKIFGDDLYIELMTNTMDLQKETNAKLIQLASALEIKTVVTTDAHYLTEEDADAHDAWTCLRYDKKVTDQNRIRQEVNDYHLDVAIPDYLQEHTKYIAEIVDKCNVTISFDEFMFPESDLADPMGHIRLKCIETLNSLSVIIDDFSVYSERLEKELAVIESQGFGHYFVIIEDVIIYCVRNGIRVGPGRGSGAGSLVCYLLGITGKDPIEHGLIFERFIHEDRISYPDLDLDFQPSRRQEVVDYIKEKYGNQHVASICNYSTLKPKASIKDAMRVLGIEYGLADEVSKLIPGGVETLAQALELSDELRLKLERSPLLKQAFNLAQKFEGRVRQAGTHAAGLVVSSVPLNEIVPLQKIPKTGEIVTQYEMRSIEKLGLLKMDILGLKTLDIIDDCIKMLQKDEKISGEPHWNTKDPAVYKMLAMGNTSGTFMTETPLLTGAAKDFKVDSFEALSLILAIYRPASMLSGQTATCLHNKNNPDDIIRIHPLVDNILSETYGTVAYQEQLTAIFGELGDMSYSQADVIRKLIGKGAQLLKRDKEKMLASSKTIFFEGAKRKKIPKKVIDTVWSIAKNAGYGFNKSHSISYADITFQTAFLKHYYPEYFMAAVLSHAENKKGEEKLSGYIREARRMDIEILKPHIFKSKAKFIVEDGKIRYGFLAIKDIGVKAAPKLEEDVDAFKQAFKSRKSIPAVG